MAPDRLAAVSAGAGLTPEPAGRAWSFVAVVQALSGRIPDRVITALMMAPTILLLTVVFALPLVVSAVVSFFGKADSSELIPSSFIGTENYSDLLTDPDFIGTVLRTLLYTTATVSLQLAVGFLMALVLNVDLRGMRLIRTILIVPMMMTPIVAALMWKLGLDFDHGFMNHLVPGGMVWLGSPVPAFASIVGVSVWQNAPYVALILLAGLRTVPGDLQDAAVVDGATRLQRLRHVIVPIIMPYILLSILLRTIYEFRAFDNVYIMTGGGPGTSTLVLSLFTYIQSFVSYDLGLSAASAWVMLALTLVLCGTLVILLRTRISGDAS